jgi:hypothetical protein
MTLERFTFERAPRDRFLALGDALRGDAPAPRNEPALLDEASPFAREGGAHLNVLLDDGPGARARVTAALPTGLDVDGRRGGTLGLFAADSDEAARAVVDEAAAWLRDRGAEVALGPVNFSTWHDYRAVTGGYDNGFFLLEPPSGATDADRLRALGFTERAGYATLKIPHVDTRLLRASRRRAERQGVRLHPLEDGEPGDVLDRIYAISSAIFASKPGFRPISRAAFDELYDGASALLVPGLSWVATSSDGAPLGFLFAYPDLLGLQRGERRTVLKTLALVPGAPQCLGWALCHAHVHGALALDFTHGLYALMEKYEPLLAYSRRDDWMPDGARGEVFKTYALFERDLNPPRSKQ